MYMVGFLQDKAKKKPAGCGGPVADREWTRESSPSMRASRAGRIAPPPTPGARRRSRVARADRSGDGDPLAHGAKHPDSARPRQLQSSDFVPRRALEDDEERSAEL